MSDLKLKDAIDRIISVIRATGRDMPDLPMLEWLPGDPPPVITTLRLAAHCIEVQERDLVRMREANQELAAAIHQRVVDLNHALGFTGTPHGWDVAIGTVKNRIAELKHLAQQVLDLQKELAAPAVHIKQAKVTGFGDLLIESDSPEGPRPGRYRFVSDAVTKMSKQPHGASWQREANANDLQILLTALKHAGWERPAIIETSASAMSRAAEFICATMLEVSKAKAKRAAIDAKLATCPLPEDWRAWVWSESLRDGTPVTGRAFAGVTVPGWEIRLLHTADDSRIHAPESWSVVCGGVDMHVMASGSTKTWDGAKKRAVAAARREWARQQ